MPTIQQAFDLQEQGDFDKACDICQSILADSPQDTGVLKLLSKILVQKQDFEQALPVLKQAVSLEPDVPFLHFWLGLAFVQFNQFASALECFEKVTVLNPKHLQAFLQKGALYHQLDKMVKAEHCFRRALQLSPQSANVHCNIGVVLRAQNNPDKAEYHYREAIRLQPDYADAYGNFANTLRDLGHLDEAESICLKAIDLAPGQANYHANLGGILRDQGRFDEAEVAYRKALGLNPNHGDAHLTLGILALAKGDFSVGWSEYEWRWKAKELKAKPREFSEPAWDGSDNCGKRLLIWREQGFGDFLFALRFLPLLADRGFQVYLEAPIELVELVRDLPGVCQCITEGDAFSDFDVHCPVMSLPYRCHTVVDNIPNSVPFLCADPLLVKSWKKKISHKAPLKVGIVWTGNDRNKSNSQRSIPLPLLESIFAMPNVQFYSLQVGADEGVLKTRFPNVVPLGSQFDSFADTAAVIENLDVVITVCTSVAHLAGSLGKPTWVLLCFVPYWMWFYDRDDSPWYPSIRLFRQKKQDDWTPVIDDVKQALLAGLPRV